MLQPYLADHPEVLRALVGKIRINEANAAALRLVGAHSKRQFIAWREGICAPANVHFSVEKLQAVWGGREALLNRTVPVTALDGRDLTVQLSIVIPSASQGYHSVPVSTLDVTADANLRRREEELALILGSTGEGIFGMDTAGRCSFVNRAALRILGYQDELALLGRDMHSLDPPHVPRRHA